MQVRYPRTVPELPEVESYRRLAEKALFRTVASVASPDAWFLKGGTTARSLRQALVGHRFVAALRTGKLLLLELDTGSTLGIRFGMTGDLGVDGSFGVEPMLYAPRRRKSEWNRWSVKFEDGGSLVVNDPRRLGGVTLGADASGLGPDAATISVGELARALRGSSAPLKARLLDQSRVAGIGNLMADEVLWRSSLSPLRSADSVSPSEVRRLQRHLVRTISDMIERGGSHCGDVTDERHLGGRCPRDGTELTTAQVGGRTTWWCPLHQL
jgi:formamidopyrimidine-DNA glycosylase